MRIARRLLFAVLALAAGCARYRPALRGEFDVVHDPASGATVVPRAEGGVERTLVRHPDLPGPPLPIVVAVGNVAVFEAARGVRDVDVAGDAAEVWFTPGKHVYVRGAHAGNSRLRLRIGRRQERFFPIEVR